MIRQKYTLVQRIPRCARVRDIGHARENRSRSTPTRLRCLGESISLLSLLSARSTGSRLVALAPAQVTSLSLSLSHLKNEHQLLSHHSLTVARRLVSLAGISSLALAGALALQTRKPPSSSSKARATTPPAQQGEEEPREPQSARSSRSAKRAQSQSRLEGALVAAAAESSAAPSAAPSAAASSSKATRWVPSSGAASWKLDKAPLLPLSLIHI